MPQQQCKVPPCGEWLWGSRVGCLQCGKLSRFCHESHDNYCVLKAPAPRVKWICDDFSLHSLRKSERNPVKQRLQRESPARSGLKAAQLSAVHSPEVPLWSDSSPNGAESNFWPLADSLGKTNPPGGTGCQGRAQRLLASRRFPETLAVALCSPE
ncbi:unnamed protein product [Lepidochelys kempii]